MLPGSRTSDLLCHYHDMFAIECESLSTLQFVLDTETNTASRRLRRCQFLVPAAGVKQSNLQVILASRHQSRSRRFLRRQALHVTEFARAVSRLLCFEGVSTLQWNIDTESRAASPQSHTMSRLFVAAGAVCRSRDTHADIRFPAAVIAV